jgi:hypothetical protein
VEQHPIYRTLLTLGSETFVCTVFPKTFELNFSKNSVFFVVEPYLFCSLQTFNLYTILGIVATNNFGHLNYFESTKVVIAYIATTVTEAFYLMYAFIPQQQK